MTRSDYGHREPITITVPYEDCEFNKYTVCSAEVIFNGWKGSVGKVIDFIDVKRRILSVHLEVDQIMIKLSEGICDIPDFMTDLETTPLKKVGPDDQE